MSEIKRAETSRLSFTGIVFSDEVASLKRLRVTAGLVAGLGVCLVLGSLPGLGLVQWDHSHSAEGVTLIASALAALVAMRATVTWALQRQRNIESSERAHRETVYEELVAHMTQSFTAHHLGPEQRAQRMQREAEVRAKVALWGSDEVLVALTEWSSLGAQIMTTSQGQTDSITKPALFESFKHVLMSARIDVLPETRVDAEKIMAMIFNDYEGPKQ